MPRVRPTSSVESERAPASPEGLLDAVCTRSAFALGVTAAVALLLNTAFAAARATRSWFEDVITTLAVGAGGGGAPSEPPPPQAASSAAARAVAPIV
ncbi:MAG: hypothetical protein AMXMBFR72_23660 [Betaproteobacteria bacterium]|nr:MAG: hypothetical protein BroJett031_04150 [Betaproteobacteria bacterium]